MDEENQNTTTFDAKPPKKGGVAKKVIIAVLVVVLLAAVVVGILIATGVIKFNINKKSKMQAGIDQLVESFTDPADKIMETAEKNGSKIKVAEHMTAGQAMDVSTEISANIEELSIPNMSASQSDMIGKVKNLVNDLSIALNFKYDGNKQFYANAKGNVGNVSISGDAVYDGTKLGLRSEELSSKWLTVTNDQFKQLLSKNGVDVDQVAEKLPEILKKVNDVAKSMEIDEKTQDEIQERYKKVFKDFIKDKSKKIKTKSAKVEVDGKKKSCTKLTLEFDKDDAKDLLKEYVDTFADDEQVKGILNNYLNGLQDIVKTAGGNSTQDVTSQFNDLLSNTDAIKSEIDKIDFEGKIVLEVYGTLTKTYRTDIIFKVDEDNDDNNVAIETTFNKNETVLKLVAADKEFATIALASDKNSLDLKIETSDDVKSLIGEKIKGDIKFVTEQAKTQMTISMETEKSGKVTMNLTENINKNEDTEYEGTTVFDINADIPDKFTAKLSINIKSNVKTAGVEIPSIPQADSLDATNESDLQNYMTDAQSKLTGLQQKLQQVESVKALMNSTTPTMNNTTPDVNTSIPMPDVNNTTTENTTLPMPDVNNTTYENTTMPDYTNTTTDGNATSLDTNVVF